MNWPISLLECHGNRQILTNQSRCHPASSPHRSWLASVDTFYHVCERVVGKAVRLYPPHPYLLMWFALFDFFFPPLSSHPSFFLSDFFPISLSPSLSLPLQRHLIKKAWLIYMAMFDLNYTPNRTKLGSSVNVKHSLSSLSFLQLSRSHSLSRSLPASVGTGVGCCLTLGGTCSNDERDYGF